MTTTTRILAGMAGTAALAIPYLIPEGWGPVFAGSGLCALGIGIAVFGNT